MNLKITTIKRMSVLALTAFAAAGLTACSINGGTFSLFSVGGMVSDTIELEEFEDLEVDMSSYDVMISRGSAYGIEYVAEKGREPKVTQNDGKLEVKQPSKPLFSFGVKLGKGDAYYKILVPSDAGEISLKVKSSSGDVTLDRIPLSGEVKTSSGDILLNDIEGSMLAAETSSGNIDADKVKAKVLSGGTSSGEVQLFRIEADDITCNTSSGDISINNSEAVTVTCHAASGEVEIELNGDPDDYSYYADTSSGDIKVNGTSAKKEFVKENNKGGKIAVDTSSGDIEIEVKK